MTEEWVTAEKQIARISHSQMPAEFLSLLACAFRPQGLMHVKTATDTDGEGYSCERNLTSHFHAKDSLDLCRYAPGRLLPLTLPRYPPTESMPCGNVML